MTSRPAGLRQRGSLIVRGSLALMIVLFAGAAVYRSIAPSSHVHHATSAAYEFFASPKKFSCELDVASATSTLPTQAYCEMSTASRTAHVTLLPSGDYSTCVGPTCGSNAAIDTPTFVAPSTVVSGPFRCSVGVAEVTCRVASGVGFRMTTTAITPVR